jgi:hypothetical protein
MVGFTVSVMITEKEHVLDRPTLSTAVHVTVVVPKLNVYGLNVDATGLHATLLMPEPSFAVTVGR